MPKNTIFRSINLHLEYFVLRLFLISFMLTRDANMISRRTELNNSIQDTICSYIDSLPAGPNNGFEITGKFEGHSRFSDSVFYKTHLRDIRLDEHVFQFTPSVVSKNGILEITKAGQLTLLDLNFNPLDCNHFFSFENNKLILHFDDDALHRKTHPYSGIAKLGIFAVAATAAIAIGPQVLTLVKEDIARGFG